MSDTEGSINYESINEMTKDHRIGFISKYFEKLVSYEEEIVAHIEKRVSNEAELMEVNQLIEQVNVTFKKYKQIFQIINTLEKKELRESSENLSYVMLDLNKFAKKKFQFQKLLRNLFLLKISYKNSLDKAEPLTAKKELAKLEFVYDIIKLELENVCQTKEFYKQNLTSESAVQFDTKINSCKQLLEKLDDQRKIYAGGIEDKESKEGDEGDKEEENKGVNVAPLSELINVSVNKEFCLLSEPCKHYVTINDICVTKIAPIVVNLCKLFNIDPPYCTLSEPE